MRVSRSSNGDLGELERTSISARQDEGDSETAACPGALSSSAGTVLPSDATLSLMLGLQL